jgi:hypothetical protein
LIVLAANIPHQAGLQSCGMVKSCSREYQPRSVPAWLGAGSHRQADGKGWLPRGYNGIILISGAIFYGKTKQYQVVFVDEIREG